MENVDILPVRISGRSKQYDEERGKKGKEKRRRKDKGIYLSDVAEKMNAVLFAIDQIYRENMTDDQKELPGMMSDIYDAFLDIPVSGPRFDEEEEALNLLRFQFEIVPFIQFDPKRHTGDTRESRYRRLLKESQEKSFYNAIALTFIYKIHRSIVSEKKDYEKAGKKQPVDVTRLPSSFLPIRPNASSKPSPSSTGLMSPKLSKIFDLTRDLVPGYQAGTNSSAATASQPSPSTTHAPRSETPAPRLVMPRVATKGESNTTFINLTKLTQGLFPYSSSSSSSTSSTSPSSLSPNVTVTMRTSASGNETLPTATLKKSTTTSTSAISDAEKVNLFKILSLTEGLLPINMQRGSSVQATTIPDTTSPPLPIDTDTSPFSLPLRTTRDKKYLELTSFAPFTLHNKVQYSNEFQDLVRNALLNLKLKLDPRVQNDIRKALDYMIDFIYSSKKLYLKNNPGGQYVSTILEESYNPEETINNTYYYLLTLDYFKRYAYDLEANVSRNQFDGFLNKIQEFLEVVSGPIAKLVVENM